jgi:hypothetical protein
LYVLLRPAKGGKTKSIGGNHFPQPPPTSPVPEHLQHLVMTNYPPETCKWQLSGPQFPTPTAIQQRYCYPQGREEYSQCTGSALWTMYNTDGVENKEYRLLHVYYSTKRLHNGGVRSGKCTSENTLENQDIKIDDGSIYTSDSISTKSTSKQRKLPKRLKTNDSTNRTQPKHQPVAKILPSPAAASTTTTAPPQLRNSFPSMQPQHHCLPKLSNTATNFLPTTPIRYGPTSYHPSHTTSRTNGYTISPPSPWPESSNGNNFGLSQNHTYSYRPQQPFQRHYDRSTLVMGSNYYDERAHHNHDAYEYSYDNHNHHLANSVSPPTPQILPFRRQHHQERYNSHHPFDNYERTVVDSTKLNDTTTTTERTILSSSTDETFPNFSNELEHHNDDIHSIMMTPIHFENEGADDTDSVSLWEKVTSDPIAMTPGSDPFTRMTRPSIRHEGDTSRNHTMTTPDSVEMQNSSIHFQKSLEVVHTKLRDCIQQAPSHDQAELVALLSTWARQLADNPLTLLELSSPSANVSTDNITMMTIDHNNHPLLLSGNDRNDDNEPPSEPLLVTKSGENGYKNSYDGTSDETDMKCLHVMAI